jgi:hypothetical protein
MPRPILSYRPVLHRYTYFVYASRLGAVASIITASFSLREFRSALVFYTHDAPRLNLASNRRRPDWESSCLAELLRGRRARRQRRIPPQNLAPLLSIREAPLPPAPLLPTSLPQMIVR